MKNIKKLILFLVFGFLLLHSSFFGIVIAADDTSCKTCTMPSLEFQSYVNFQVEMLQILQNALKEKNEKISPTKFGLFSSRILSLSANLVASWVSMFKKGADEIVEGYRVIKMGAIMLGSITNELVTKDTTGGLKILFRNEPFVREWATLQDLDMSIHDAMWDLGTKGIWDDVVSDDILNSIDSLKFKYSTEFNGDLALFDKFIVKGDIRYKDVVSMLSKLNSVMKMFVSNYSAMKSADAYDVFLQKMSIDIEKGDVIWQFNQNLMRNMFDSYRCAVGVSACNDMWKSFADNTKVWSQIKIGLLESKDIIQKANERFLDAILGITSSVKDTFSPNKNNEELGLSSKQLSLLRSVYGIDTTKLSKEQGIGLEKVVFAVANPQKTINNINLGVSDYFSSESKKYREETKSLERARKAQEKYLASLSVQEAKKAELELLQRLENRANYDTYDSQKLRENLFRTLDDVLMEKQSDKNIIVVYNSFPVMRYFVQIGSFIHDIIDDSIGSKDGGLIQYLGETCEAQCTNKGTQNCYAK